MRLSRIKNDEDENFQRLQTVASKIFFVVLSSLNLHTGKSESPEAIFLDQKT